MLERESLDGFDHVYNISLSGTVYINLNFMFLTVASPSPSVNGPHFLVIYIMYYWGCGQVFISFDNIIHNIDLSTS